MKKPQMVDRPGRVAFRSASLWLNRLGVAVVIGPNLLYKYTGIDYNPYFITMVWLGLSFGVEISRYFRQNSLHSPMMVGVIALLFGWGQITLPWEQPKPIYSEAGVPYSDREFLEVALPLVKKWEGLRLKPYYDSAGVLTICFGETKNVRPNDQYTEAECEAMLTPRLLEHRGGWMNYLTTETLEKRLHPDRDAAFSSLAFNIGVTAAGTSTATKRLNKGDIAGACGAITWYRKAGGMVLLGLVRRRKDEYKHCMIGVNT